MTALFAAYQGLTKKQIHNKAYFWVFIVTAFVCSCFLAWHDEHKNTETVIAEKSQWAGQANTCASEFASARATLAGKEELATSLQGTLTKLQAPQLQQQVTLNTCVVALSQANAIKQETTTLSRSFDLDEQRKSGKYFTFITLLTNKIIAPASFNVRCEAKINSMSIMPVQGGSNNLFSADDQLFEDGHSGYVTLNSTPWAPKSPVFILLSHDQNGLGNCSITSR